MYISHICLVLDVSINNVWLRSSHSMSVLLQQRSTLAMNCTCPPQHPMMQCRLSRLLLLQLNQCWGCVEKGWKKSVLVRSISQPDLVSEAGVQTLSAALTPHIKQAQKPQHNKGEKVCLGERYLIIVPPLLCLNDKGPHIRNGHLYRALAGGFLLRDQVRRGGRGEAHMDIRLRRGGMGGRL